MAEVFSCGFYDIDTLIEALKIARSRVPADKVVLTSFQPGANAQITLVANADVYDLIITSGKSQIGERVRCDRIAKMTGR